MSDTTRAGTLRAPRSPGEYLEAKRENEWVHRWFLREALRAQAGEYRGLFEKEEQERAKALAALQQDLVRAHERIGELEYELDLYRDTRPLRRLHLGILRLALRVKRWFVPDAWHEVIIDHRGRRQLLSASRPIHPEPRTGEDRD